MSKPVALCILDGWGDRQETEGNAVALANTANFDRLRARWPSAQLNTSGAAVGLPEGQMGNSEVGHINIGAGRVVKQTLPRIDSAIAQNSIEEHSAWCALIEKTKAAQGALHVLGLVSDGGVHSHQSHLIHLVNLAKQAGLVVHIHAFADGRDTDPHGFIGYLAEVEAGCGQPVSTAIGRYYAMDRDKRWERVERAHSLLVDGKAETVTQDISATVTEAYARDLTDEFLPAIKQETYDGMKDGDGLVVANFRADRVREILAALLLPSFDGFERARTVKFASALGLTPYASELDPVIGALFPAQNLTNVLGEVVANAGLKQIRAAETEKYPHVTYFLNGGREEPFEGEARVMAPSPKVATYDLSPEMSARPLIAAVLEKLDELQPALLVLNFANPDMVGHTGDLQAAIKAVEAVDDCLGQLWNAVEASGGQLLVIADHGNCELMVNPDGSAHTAHTTNPVPVIACGVGSTELASGCLADVAPTLLAMIARDEAIAQPADMTGISLLK